MSTSRQVEGLSCSTCAWNNDILCPLQVRSVVWSDNLDYCSYYEDKETRDDIVAIVLLREG